MKNTSIVIHQLTTIESATCKLVTMDGSSSGILSLATGGGIIQMDLQQFDAIYAGFVKCWPSIKPVKEQLTLVLREETKLASVAARAAKDEARKAERATAALAAQKLKEDAKAERDEAKAAAKAVKLKALDDAAAAKLKADNLRLTEAANKAAAAGKLDKPVALAGKGNSVDKAVDKAAKKAAKK